MSVDEAAVGHHVVTMAGTVTPLPDAGSPADEPATAARRERARLAARLRKRAERARKANGVTWLADTRSAWGRRLRETWHDLVSDHAGADNLSAAKRNVLHRAAVLSVELDRLELQLADGTANRNDLATYQRAAHSLLHMLQAVGLERVPRDVTPSLADLIAEASVAPAEAADAFFARPESCALPDGVSRASESLSRAGAVPQRPGSVEGHGCDSRAAAEGEM